MSGIKGYPTQEKEDRLAQQFATVEPIRELQHGMSVVAHIYTYQVGTDAVEASSTTKSVNATAHAAKKGDVIRFTSGTLSGQEVKVISTATNSFDLAEELPSAPATGVNFEILRHKYPKILADGSLSVGGGGAIQFVKDASTVSVTEDTVTPSNNIPLPVKLSSVTGDINITAGDLNVQLSHTGGSYDSTRIGDGTDLMAVNADGSLNAVVTATDLDIRDLTSVSDSVSAVQSGTWNITNVSGTVSLPTGAATETTLSTLNGKVPSNLTVTATRLLVDGSGVTQPVSATDLDIRDLASGTDSVSAVQSGTWNITNVSGTVSLPTGAATSANQTTANSSLSSIDGKIPASLTVTSTRLLVDGSGVTQPVSAASLPLPTGASTEATLSTLEGKVPANLTVSSTRLLVDGSGVTQPVSGTVQTAAKTVVTTTRNDYSSVNVTTGAWVQLIASTGSTINEFDIFDSSGQTLEIGTGAAASETRLILVFPGGNGKVPVTIASGTRISIRAVSATANSGEIDINWYS